MKTVEELLAEGGRLRETTPRSTLGTGFATDRDPLAILDAQNASRLPWLVPVRWGRMAESPFAFYRGAAALMAHDLAPTPTTGVRVQACGDAHVSNFGFYASPERDLVFDLNDFDETLPAPWEWDVERLVASAAVASRAAGRTASQVRKDARAAATNYRNSMRRAARMSARELFHTVVTAEALLDLGARTEGSDRERRARIKAIQRATKQARGRTSEQAIGKLATFTEDGKLRMVDMPPLIVHPVKAPSDAALVPELYRNSVTEDIEALLRRYEQTDFALKVVGVGSVGTRCFVQLSVDSTGSPLMLQVKEASASVLEPHAGAGRYERQGRRIVAGQRIMQAVSDPFLGWTVSEGREYYVRQFRDMKGGFDLDRLSASLLDDYARLCGAVLARAHAQSCEPALIAGYLGGGDAFDDAMEEFAIRYADQNEADYAALLAAIESGRIKADRAG